MGFEAKLAFSFHRHSIFSRKPVTDKLTKEQWLNELKEKGYQIFESKKGNDRELISCPENEKLLIQLVQKQFPSALVDEFKTRIIFESEEPLFEIHYMKVYIKDLTELKELENEFKEHEEEA